MRFPQHVANFLPDEPERIKLINAQERQYLEKHKSWSYEQEVRLLLKAPLAWLMGEHMSFTKHERLFHYQPTQLVGIITGPLMREEYRQQIYEIIRDRVSRHSYTGDGVKTEVFDFVFFEAELEDDDRHIEVTPTKILSLSQETNKSDNGFDEKYQEWLDGWAIVFRGVESIKSTDFVIGAACRFCVLTHNLTHNRKRAGGGNGVESTIASDFLEQNAPRAPYGGVSRVGNQLVRTERRAHVEIILSKTRKNLLQTRILFANQHFSCRFQLAFLA